MTQKKDKNFMKLTKSTKGGHSYVPNSDNTKVVVCAACSTEIFPKQGFRISKLFCPKCGKSVAIK